MDPNMTPNTPKGTPMDSAVLAAVTLPADLRTAHATGGDTLPSCRAPRRTWHLARGHHLAADGGAR